MIHSLEHGAAIVWYSPDVSGRELEDLKEFYRDVEVGSRVIVAPYDYPTEGDRDGSPRERRWRSWRGTTSSAVPG